MKRICWIVSQPLEIRLLYLHYIQGRNEVLSLLKRKRYKEMMLAALEKKRLRFSPLDMRFHLRDLIGSGHLKIVQTPTGLIIRVSKDWSIHRVALCSKTESLTAEGPFIVHLWNRFSWFMRMFFFPLIYLIVVRVVNYPNEEVYCGD